MADHPPPPGGVPYETKDANARSVVIFGIGLAVVIIVVQAFLAWLFGLFERRDVGRGEPVSQVAEPAREPPAPRLQVNPYGDLEMLRKHEQQMLTTYGWVDRNAGRVRIPIDRAMDLTAQRGIPPAAAPQEGKRQPVEHPTPGGPSPASLPMERSPK